MEQEITNQEILKRLNQMQSDINILKEKISEDGELTDWAKSELEEARNRTDKISHEEVRKTILAK
jgi:hypothetical protein